MAEILQGDVKVPGIGKTKKWVVYGAGGVAIGYVAFRWYQATRGGDEGAAGSDGLYSTDDLSELGRSTTGGSTVVAGNTGSTSTDATNPNAIDTNAEWTLRAVEVLANSGYDPAVVHTALGEFLARRALDKAEATIARAALASAGQPPEGRPWTVIEEATTGGTGTLPAPTGLKVAPSTDKATVSWGAVDGAAGYLLYRNDQLITAPQTVSGTSLVMYNLTPGREYKVQVAAQGTGGKPGPKSAQVKFKTTHPKMTAPTGLKSDRVTPTSFRVRCTPVAGATIYHWYLDGRSLGASQGPERTFTGLARGRGYRVQAAADTLTGSHGPLSSSITVRTKR